MLNTDIVKLPSFQDSFNDLIQFTTDKNKKEENLKKLQKDVAAVESIVFAMQNDGVLPNGTKLVLKDVFTSTNMLKYRAPAVEHIVRGAVEPKLNITPLFHQISVPGNAIVTIDAFGTFDVGEVAEGQEYPEKIFGGSGKGQIGFSFKKYGVAIGLTEEAIAADNWGFVSYWLEQAGYAFARKREEVAYNAIKLMGYTLLDNTATTVDASPLGKTKGRDITGAYNGTIIPEDIVKALAYGALLGVNYRVLMMNPMAYMMFMFSPAMSTIVSAREILGNWIPSGSAAKGWEGPFGKWSLPYSKVGNPTMNTALGKLGIQPGVTSLSMLGASFYTNPNINGQRLQIILSPFVRWETSGSDHITDLYLIDPDNLGAFFNRQGISVDRWEEKKNDITYIKMKEVYGVALYNQGLGVGILKNIIVTEESYKFNLYAQATNLEAYSPTTARP